MLKNILTAIFVSTFICAAATAQAQAQAQAQVQENAAQQQTTTQGDPRTIDKIVAVVGNSAILYSDVKEAVKEFAERRREQGYTLDRDAEIEALEELLQQKLLYNQALIDSVEINKEYAASQTEDYLTYMLGATGSVAKLEERFHRPIFEIRREINSRYEEQMYAQAMRRELLSKVTIAPGEVERFYSRINKDSIPMIPIQYTYAQITKFPLSTQEAKLRARTQLLGLRERIIGGTRFDVLARMYSEDGSAARGGEMDPMPAENFEAPFARALEKLRPGQVSEVVETIYGFHLIQLIDKQGNLYHARHILVRPQFTDDEMKATDRTLDSLAGAIRAGDITFERAVLENSDDKYSKLNGGVVTNLEMLEMHQAGSATYATTSHYKEDLSPDDFRALDALKPGEISPAFQSADMRGNKLSKIVKLIEITPSHPASLTDDYLELEALALDKKRSDYYDAWITRKIDGMYVRIDPAYRKPEEFQNKAWIK